MTAAEMTPMVTYS